ncbi:DUF3047 domain-containing protein [Accumulibacter sp.]|uniref:DUF3047 domain-containing protein n=1 Tax=Accumulibacter sp. TaxID=2053492 RepID=UPI001A42FD46|nr:DUF3047 domain-containing protein [Accumulibacter sp.]MBL8374251.1 DUF3047 domain-containing protein [Accumulibacter sp.]
MEPMNNRRRRTSLALLATPVISAFSLLSTPAARAESTGVARVDLPRFSAEPVGHRLPAGWTHQTLPSVERANRFDLLADDGRTVLRVLSDRSASSLALAKRIDPAVTPLLRWRWRVSNALAGSDLQRKVGDDYAARVYVLFDLPPERLGVGDRMKMAAARLLHGAELPAAALCYVWGTAQAAGESGWNAYTDRLRMIVVDSGKAHAGQWRDVVRDVAADFRAAFGDPLPLISGIALGADTDNTGERVEARFGDLWFEARRQTGGAA